MTIYYVCEECGGKYFEELSECPACGEDGLLRRFDRPTGRLVTVFCDSCEYEFTSEEAPGCLDDACPNCGEFGTLSAAPSGARAEPEHQLGNRLCYRRVRR